MVRRLPVGIPSRVMGSRPADGRPVDAQRPVQSPGFRLPGGQPPFVRIQGVQSGHELRVPPDDEPASQVADQEPLPTVRPEPVVRRVRGAVRIVGSHPTGSPLPAHDLVVGELVDHPIEIDEQQRPTHSCPSFHRAGRFGFDGVQPLTDGIKLIPMVGPCGPDGREFGPHGPLLRLPSTNRLFRRHRIRRSEHEERFADLFHIASGVPQRHEHGLRVG